MQGLWADPWKEEDSSELYYSKGYCFRVRTSDGNNTAEIQGVTHDFIENLWVNPVFDENGNENTNWQNSNTAKETSLVIPSTLTIADGNGTEYTVVSLDSNAFEEAFPQGDGSTKWENHYFDGIKELTIPPAVYSIGEFMFDGWQNLETVTIYSDVIDIWNCAFANCTSLTTVYMYGKTVNLHGYTFAEDVALKNFYLTNVESLTVESPDNAFSCKTNTVTDESGNEISSDNAVAGCTIYLPEDFVYNFEKDEDDTGKVSATVHKYGNIVQGGTKTNTKTNATTDDNSYVESLLSNGYKISAITLEYEEIVPNEDVEDEELTATVDKETNTVTVNYDIEGGVQLKATVTLQLYYNGTEIEDYTLTETVDETYTNILSWNISTSSDYGDTQSDSDISIENLLITNNHKVSDDIAPITANITVSAKEDDTSITANCTVDFADYVSSITLPGSVVVLVGTSEPVEVHIELKYAGVLSSTESINFTYDETAYGNYATVNVNESDGTVYVTGIAIPTYSSSSSGGGGGGGGASSETDSAVPVFYVSYGTEEKHEVYIYVNDITEVKFYEPDTDGSTASTTEATSVTLDLNTDDTVKKLFSDFTWYDTAQFHTPPSDATTTSNWLLYFAEGKADDDTDGIVETVAIDEQNANEIDITAVTPGTGRVIAIPKNKVVTAEDGSTSLPENFDADGSTIPYAECEVIVIKTSLEITPEQTTVVVGSTGNTMPTVTILPETYTSFKQDDIVWTIKDNSGNEVTTNDFTISNGYFTASSTPGTYTFTASIKDNESIEPVSCTVTVVTINSITLSQTEINLITNDDNAKSAELTATIVWWDGTNTVDYQNDNYVTWSVTNSENVIEFCSSTGTITAVANGTATITATSSLDTDKTATCTVKVTTKVESISIADVTITKADAGTKDVPTVTYLPEGKVSDIYKTGVTWTAGDESIISVEDGVITANGAGSTTLTAYYTDEISASCTVTVENYVTGLTLTAETKEAKVGETVKLTFNGMLAYTNQEIDNYITWSDNVTLGENGSITVTSNTVGDVTVTVTAKDNNTVTASITVTFVNYVREIKFSETSYTLNYEEGETLSLFDQITATWADTKAESDEPHYTFSFENEEQDVVTIDATSGTVTPLKAGTVKVTVTEAGGATATCDITVKAITGIEINDETLYFVLRENDNHTATLYVKSINWDGAQNQSFDNPNCQPDKVIWYSRNSEIATVDENGNVTAVGAGTTTIVAKYVYKKSDETYGNAFYATCTVTVTTGVNYVTNIAFSNANYVLNLEEANPSIALPEIEVTWADQDNPGDITPTITFDPEGIITIEDGAIVPTADYKTGKVEVTATYTEPATDVTFTTTCTVNVVGIEELTIDSTIDYLIVGEATDLPTVAAHWSTGETVDVTADIQWDIVNGEIVDGQVVATRGGTVVISATYYFTENGRKHTAQISIRALVDPVETTAIELSPTYLTLAVGETANLTAIIWSDGATALTFEWSSNNTSVATVEAKNEFVSETGVVTAVGVGTATITVQYGNLSATCLVTVTADSSSGNDGNVDLDGDDNTPHPTPLPDDGNDDESTNPDDPNNSDNNDDADNSDDDATNRDGVIINPDEAGNADNESSQDTEEDEDVDYNRNKGEVYEYMRFNLAGQRIEGPQRGINIIKYSDGSKQKVLVK